MLNCLKDTAVTICENRLNLKIQKPSTALLKGEESVIVHKNVRFSDSVM